MFTISDFVDAPPLKDTHNSWTVGSLHKSFFIEEKNSMDTSNCEDNIYIFLTQAELKYMFNNIIIHVDYYDFFFWVK